ncbi:triacylglycerol lipase [Haloferula luteola]|uniref:Triacylglycerol lipase n=1 Tax=Haloferula luteola TaxID=595692 RepID=A0A840V6K1_9BACT|nr:alpha/beta fold hydrolase [Haloferula luteola]MBB5352656.1 triacylglycerol lipase [Haloferula luteola]
MPSPFLIPLIATASLAAAQLPEQAWQPVEARQIVLVHGIWQNESLSFGRLRTQLEKAGIPCISPSLKPADGRDGLEPMAQQLQQSIDEQWGPESHFVVVAFSMGGLISRYYLQELGGAERCDAFVTLSTPHHGTQMAFFHYGLGAAEMRPESPFLHQLQKSADQLTGIPLLSYRAEQDWVIVPRESSIWEPAVNIELPVYLHPSMPKASCFIADFLTRFEFPEATRPDLLDPQIFATPERPSTTRPRFSGFRRGL